MLKLQTWIATVLWLQMFTHWKTPILFRLPYETIERVYLNRLKAIPFYIHTPLPPPPHCSLNDVLVWYPSLKLPNFSFPLEKEIRNQVQIFIKSIQSNLLRNDFWSPFRKSQLWGTGGGGGRGGYGMACTPTSSITSSFLLLLYIPPLYASITICT